MIAEGVDARFCRLHGEVEALRRALAVAAGAVAVAVPAVSASAPIAPVLCRGTALTVVFRVVPGSAPWI